jgi:hypothetical protein
MRQVSAALQALQARNDPEPVRGEDTTDLARRQHDLSSQDDASSWVGYEATHPLTWLPDAALSAGWHGLE